MPTVIETGRAQIREVNLVGSGRRVEKVIPSGRPVGGEYLRWASNTRGRGVFANLAKAVSHLPGIGHPSSANK